MRRWRLKICALAILLVLTPGAVEIVENGTHLLTEGHLAHSAADGDRHEPAGPEHGCTPTFHLCGCHASLALVVGLASPAVALRAAGFVSRLAPDSLLTGFRPAIERPPRV